MDRFREHLKALGGDKGGGGSAAAPLVKRLLDAEDKLAAAKKQRDTLARELETRWATVWAILGKLPELK